MQKAPGHNVRRLSVFYMGKGAERSRRVRCLLLEEKVASFACRMRWKCCGFLQRYRPCGVYPTTPHPSRRDRRATFPSRGRLEKCAANGPRQSPRTQCPGAFCILYGKGGGAEPPRALPSPCREGGKLCLPDEVEMLRFFQRHRLCGLYPTTPHPSRRDRRATFPSRGRLEKCAANGPRQSPPDAISEGFLHSIWERGRSGAAACAAFSLPRRCKLCLPDEVEMLRFFPAAPVARCISNDTLSVAAWPPRHLPLKGKA